MSCDVMKVPKNQTSYYDAHARVEAEQAAASQMAACYAAPASLEAWRHRRMQDMARPVIEADLSATWMTVGDGSYGSDAHYLQGLGVDALATSLTDHSLKIAKERGYIEKFAVVNAEQIPFGDASFDYVLCKEAYHHFPRPAIAFYEMLRVAKKAVLLIEPYSGPRRFLDIIKEPFKKMLWGKGETIHFEPSGNYIYRVNPEEIGKKMAGLGYSVVAYRTFNDIYLPMFHYAKAGASFGYVATRVAVFLQDVLCFMRLLNPASVVVISFKEMPTSIMLDRLRRYGFTINVLPVNPYI